MTNLLLKSVSLSFNKLKKPFLILLAACFFAVPAAAQNVIIPRAAARSAVDYFRQAFRDETRLPMVMVALRSTGERQLLPLFAAMMRSPDRQLRLLATASVEQLAGRDAAPALLDRLRTDPAMAVRANALVHLVAMKGISAEQLIEATKMPDEEIQIIAARALARMGKGAQATEILQTLTASRDEATAAFARMTLLGCNRDQSQIPHLSRIIKDPKTDRGLLVRLLNQIRQEKIIDALPVAKFLARPPRPMQVRIRAYMVLAELAADAAKRLYEAIRATDNTMLKVNLMRILAEQKDARRWIEPLAGGDDDISAVARFELSRPRGGRPAAGATDKLLALEHPILIEYVLNRMKTDIEKNKASAGFYARPMLKYLHSLRLDPYRLTPDHDRAAEAVALLGDLGSAEAMNGLRKILAGPDSALKKLAAGALYRSKNQAVGDLLRPLLSSAYQQQKTYAALLLARWSDRNAIGALLEIQSDARTRKDDVLALANWYILKLAGTSAPAVNEIVNTLK